MTDPIRLARPDVGEEELRAVAEVLESGQLTTGPKVADFEAALAGAVGTAHAAVVSSGTAALHLALLALGVGPGDEVIVPAYTFPATANVVELAGARAVLVDVDPDTFNVDIGSVAGAVTSRTRAVMAVHLFGRPVEWEALQTAVPQEIALLEDAAGALGARYRDTPCGSLGVAACLSFHPRKIVTTGEGGAVTTDEATLDGAVRRLRNHGWSDGRRHAGPGFNYRLPDILCAVGIPQLARLEQLLAARERVAGWYTERLESSCSPPARPTGTATAGRPTSFSSTGATMRSRGCVRRGSRRRSGRGRFTGSRRTASRGRSLVPTGRTNARSRFPSRQRPPRRRSTAS